MPNPLNPIFRQPRESSQQRPKGLRRGGSLKKSKIRGVSKKRRVQLAEYSVNRKAFLLANPACFICTTKAATECHHTAHRERERLNDFTKVIGLCEPCHKLVHAKPAWARDNGFLT